MAGLIILALGLAGYRAARGSDGSQPAGDVPRVSLSSSTVANGQLLLLELDTRNMIHPTIAGQLIYKQRTVPLHPHPKKPPGFFFALIAVPMRSSPGKEQVSFKWTDPGGRYEYRIPFETVPGSYRTETLSVAPAKVQLSQQDLKRVKNEKKKVTRVYSSGSPERLWKNRFQIPIDSKVTSPFGNRRIFNNQLKSFHRGVDLRAAVGRPVLAANDGIVRLADNLFFSGNLVIIDHGTGIFTNYAHLSQIDVAVDQSVTKGQRIGLSGVSGRVNGPHLHWGVKVNAIYVDPLQFLEVMARLAGNDE